MCVSLLAQCTVCSCCYVDCHSRPTRGEKWRFPPNVAINAEAFNIRALCVNVFPWLAVTRGALQWLRQAVYIVGLSEHRDWSGVSEGGLCVQGPLDDDGMSQVGLLQTQLLFLELSEGKWCRQDERGAIPLAARHKVLDVTDPKGFTVFRRCIMSLFYTAE